MTTSTILRDPADDHVLAAALAAQVDLIVSGDAHLLDSGRFQGIEVVAAGVALERMALAAKQGSPCLPG